MADIIKVFVSYARGEDAKYLGKGSLLGFVRGLENEGIVFWDDRCIPVGYAWDDVIKTNIQDLQIALVLISQHFLDSPYINNTEIKGFLSNKVHLFPIILSPCFWKDHTWLSQRQFLPRGDQTLEEDYTAPGKRKRLFVEIRKELRAIAKGL